MEFNYTKGKITITKELLSLDEFVLSFIALLERSHIRYVLVSGYVGIFFGRSRNTEDIDILIERCDKETVIRFWNSAIQSFACMNASDAENAFTHYLSENTALRFYEKERFIPNVEVKFIKNDVDRFTLEHRIEVELNKMHHLFFSPLEMQIAYKLFMGSEKDIEDARFVYKLFGEYLDLKLLNDLFHLLKVPRTMITQLGERV